MQVARRGNKLCVDFTTKAATSPGSALELTIRKKECAQSGPLENITLLFGPSGREVRVQPVATESTDNGIREADIRQSGNKTSVVIDRDQLPSFALFDDFMWQAMGITQHSQPTQFSDVTPDSADLLYPEGTLGGGLQGCHQTGSGVRCAPLPPGC